MLPLGLGGGGGCHTSGAKPFFLSGMASLALHSGGEGPGLQVLQFPLPWPLYLRGGVSKSLSDRKKANSFGLGLVYVATATLLVL